MIRLSTKGVPTAEKSNTDARIVYADIIDLPHHQSDRHPHMSLHDRAARFAPFAALVGYDEMVGEVARLTDVEIAPGESDLEDLNRKFRLLSEQLAVKQRSEVSVPLFVPDTRKAGAAVKPSSAGPAAWIPLKKS